ncbi:MAG: integrase core domain-containing protein [Solirubrobacteraceae bacterium]
MAAGGTRAVESLSAATAGRACPRRREEARPDRQAGPPDHRPRQRRWSPPAGLSPRLGVRPRLRRRCDPARLRRSPRRREGDHGGRLPAPRRRSLRRLRHPGRAADDRQRRRYRATIHALACKALGIKHLRTRPYRPRTNGKAERFIRTMLGGWAYGAIYQDSHERRRALAGWLDFYNRQRPHRSLGRQTPLERLHALNRNNVLGSYS